MQCERCKNTVNPNSMLETQCCKKLRCAINCASPCEFYQDGVQHTQCKRWLCNLNDMKTQSCFGLCPEHMTPMFQEQYNGLFTSREDHDEKFYLAMSKYFVDKCLDLTCFEQLLVSEEVNIEKQYPQLKGLDLKSPYT